MDEEDEEFCPECGNYSDECGCKEEWEQELPDSEKGISHDPKLGVLVRSYGIFMGIKKVVERASAEFKASIEIKDKYENPFYLLKLTLFIEGLFFWLLDRMPRDILEDYASKCLEMYDMDTARDILADCGMLRQESRF